MMFIYLFFDCKNTKTVRHIVTHHNYRQPEPLRPRSDPAPSPLRPKTVKQPVNSRSGDGGGTERGRSEKEKKTPSNISFRILFAF